MKPGKPRRPAGLRAPERAPRDVARVLLEALHASPLASPGSDAKSYVFGSVILREGDELVEDSSDVDLLVVLDSTHVSSPHEIVQRVRGLMTAVATTEACLAALLPSRRAGHHRVSSVLVATSDEIDVQAHKSKEPHFFAENVFVALDGDRSAPVPLGIHASSADRVDPARESSAIDCLAGAQSRRHEYLARTDAAGLLRDLTEKEWDPRTDPVPKVLARSAAKLADLVHRESVDVEAEAEADASHPATTRTDVNEGYRYLDARFEELSSEGPDYASVRDVLDLGRGRGRSATRRLTNEQYLLCWEVLAQDALVEVRRRRAFRSGLPRQFVIADPIHRSIRLEQAFGRLIHAPSVVRLGGIAQLPFCHAFATSATHTRLSHSLGVAHLAERAVHSLLEKGWIYFPDRRRPMRLARGIQRRMPWQLRDADADRLVRLAKIAGLLHDVGHSPFAHALDRVLSIRPEIRKLSPDGRVSTVQPTAAATDKVLGARRVKGLLSEEIRAAGCDPEVVAKIVSGNKRGLAPWDGLVAQVIDSEIDVDRIDYLLRDGLFTAYPIGQMVNTHALIDAMRPFHVVDQSGRSAIRLAYDIEFRPFVEEMILGRALMYLHVYEHRTKLAAERLLQRIAIAVLDAGTIGALELADRSDAQFLAIAADSASGLPEIAGCLRKLDSHEFGRYVEVSRHRLGDFVEPRGLDGRWADSPSKTAVEASGEIERRLCDGAGLNHADADVLVLFPSAGARSGKPSPAVSLLRGTESGGFEPVGFDRMQDELLSNGETLMDRSRIPPRDGESAAAWIARYMADANETGVSVLSIVGRARSKVLVLVHETVPGPQKAKVLETLRGMLRPPA